MVETKAICEARGCQAEKLTREKQDLEQRVRELQHQLGLMREQQKVNVREIVKEVIEQEKQQ